MSCFYNGKHPEVTGKSDNPFVLWHDRKPFTAGLKSSTNAVYSKCMDFTRETIGALKIKYKFNIIPDTEEVRAAGYSDSDLANANVFYNPVADGEYFYYTAYTTNPLAPSLPSVLVALRRSDGKVAWSRVTTQYSLDLSVNMSFCRPAPAVYGNRLYVVDYMPTNVGPQLYCIDKFTGKGIWSIAYYPPVGIQPITTKGDYSYLGQSLETSIARIGDQAPIVERLGDKANIYVGSSSLQNTSAYNPGVKRGLLPFFSDQGYVFRVQDEGKTATVRASMPTSAPLVKVGDLLSKGGPAALDPFMPAYDYTIIATQAVDSVRSPYLFSSSQPSFIPFTSRMTEGSVPIAAAISFTKSTVIDMSIFTQEAWQLTDTIYLDNGDVPRTKQELVDLWIAEQAANPGPFYYVISAYIPSDLVDDLLSQTNNLNLFFYKRINNNTRVENIYDANGLNYWGNSTWGAPSSIENDNLFVGTGQSHGMPFFENAFYSNSYYAFNNLSAQLKVAVDAYIADPTSQNLAALNAVKSRFESDLLAGVNIERSPRGALSFSDAIMSFQKVSGALNWGTRSIINDVYTFLEKDPIHITSELMADQDGDASSGIQLFDSVVSTPLKTGIALTVNKLTGDARFITYLGPTSILGGSNYQCAQSGGSDVICNQANISFGAVRETMVTREGEIYEDNQSFLTSYSVETGLVRWTSLLDGPALAEVAVANAVALSCDTNGILYGVDILDGRRLLTFDAKARNVGGGGISGPCVLNKEMIWIPSYALPIGGLGSGSLKGAVYEIDHCNLVNWCDPIESLVDKRFSARGQSDEPGIIVSACQEWKEKDCKNYTKLELNLNGLSETAYFKVSKNFEFTLMSRSGDTINFSINNLVILNASTYDLDLVLPSMVLTLTFHAADCRDSCFRVRYSDK